MTEISKRQFVAIQYIQDQVLGLQEQRDDELKSYPNEFKCICDLDYQLMEDNFLLLNAEIEELNSLHKAINWEIQQSLEEIALIDPDSAILDFSEATAQIESLVDEINNKELSESSGETGVKEILSSIHE